MKKEYDIEKLDPRRDSCDKQLKRQNKKALIITIIIMLIVFSFYLITSFKDNARVRTNMEPQYTIKIVSDNGSKVTYWGLGYKVIRYVSVSPKEPFKNNIGVKFGNWFMNYELEK